MAERLIVPDASVVVKWFLPEQDSDAACALRDDDGVRFHAPDVWYLEIGNALWKRARRGDERLRPELVRGMLADLRRVAVTTHESAGIVERAAELALDRGISVYDASYVAVAERAQATFLTADGRLARALAGHTDIRIELLRQG